MNDIPVLKPAARVEAEGIGSTALLGWSVAIRRKNGTEFLCASDHGDKPPIWSKCNRRYAVAHKRVLIESGFRARVVAVAYAEPVIVPNAMMSNIGALPDARKTETP